MLYTAAQLVAILSSISKWEIVVWCLQSWRLHWGWWSTQCKMAEDCTSRNCMTFYNIRQKWKTRKYSSPSHLTHPVWVTWLNKLSKYSLCTDSLEVNNMLCNPLYMCYSDSKWNLVGHFDLLLVCYLTYFISQGCHYRDGIKTHISEYRWPFWPV